MVFHTNLIWEFVRLFIVEQGKIRDGSCFYFIPHAVRSRQANFALVSLFEQFYPISSGLLLSIRNWCFDNQLLLNPNKTKLVIFGSRQMTAKVSDFRLFLLGKELEPVKAARDLGVTLDSNLTYNEHIVSTVFSCMSRLGQINRVKHIFDKRALIIIINALVFSKLFYCSSVWSNTTQANLDKL